MSGGNPLAPCTDQLRAQGYEPGPKCCATQGLSTLAGMALFIIGCIGAAGAFPGSSIGWVAVGLGGGGFALSLAAGNLKKRKLDLIPAAIIAAIVVTIGALGGAGVLSATQVGWGIVGTTLAAGPIFCCFSCAKQLQLQQQRNPSVRSSPVY